MDNTTHVTVNSLVDELSDYARLDTSSKLYEGIISDFIDGVGLPDICERHTLNKNIQLAERTIRGKLKEIFKDNTLVDADVINNIMVTYFRLLFFQMLVEGEKELVKFRKYTRIVRLTGRSSFIEGAERYLGNLPYGLLVHLIPQNYLFSYYVQGSNSTKFVNMMTRVENRGIRYKDFGKELGFWGETLDDYIDKQLEKMNIKVSNGYLIDSKTKQRLTFLEEKKLEAVGEVG